MQTKPRDVAPEAVVARAIARFRDSAARALPVPVSLAEELAVEAEPALRALVEATATGVDDAEELDSLEHHETLAMATLLGRKLALVGATPTAAERLVPALLGALREEGWRLPRSVDASLSVLLIEGYVRGREEKLHGEAARDVARRIPIVTLAPRVLGVFLAGRYEAEPLGAAMDELGRRLFREEIAGCLFALDGVDKPTAAVARALFAIDTSARLVGAQVVFSGLSDELRRASERAGLDLTHIELAPSTEAGLARVLARAGLTVRGTGIGARLRGLLP